MITGNASVEQKNGRVHKTQDPTENVNALSDATNKRQDDLRLAARELSDAKIAHMTEVADLREKYQKSIGTLREEYQEKLSRAEAGRLDSIRQIDREEVAKTAVSANTAIQTLAKQTTDLATTLQKTVQDTAQAAETRNSAQYTDINKRLSALELSSSEGKGKQAVVDPQMDKLVAVVSALELAARQGIGKNEGIGLSWGAFLGMGGLIITAAGALGFVFNNHVPVAPLQPQIVYVPAAPQAVPPANIIPPAPR